MSNSTTAIASEGEPPQKTARGPATRRLLISVYGVSMRSSCRVRVLSKPNRQLPCSLNAQTITSADAKPSVAMRLAERNGLTVVVTIEVPPARAIRDEMQTAIGRPFGLKDGLRRAAGDQ